MKTTKKIRDHMLSQMYYADNSHVWETLTNVLDDVDTLHASLLKYGTHLIRCKAGVYGAEAPLCDCGFSKAKEQPKDVTND